MVQLIAATTLLQSILDPAFMKSKKMKKNELFFKSRKELLEEIECLDNDVIEQRQIRFYEYNFERFILNRLRYLENFTHSLKGKIAESEKENLELKRQLYLLKVAKK